MSSQQQYLTYPEAALSAHVHPGTVARWVAQGLLTAHVDQLDRRRRLVLREDVERLTTRTVA